MDEGLVLSSSFYRQLGFGSTPQFNWIDYIHPDDKARLIALWEDFYAGGIAYYQQEYRIRDSKGAYQWLSSSVNALTYDENQKVKTYIGIDFSLNQLKARFDELERSK